MIEFTYDFYLLYTNSNKKNFRVVGIQINNILIIANDIFAITNEQELKNIKLLTKNRKKLTHNTFIKFNRGYIRLEGDRSFFPSLKNNTNICSSKKTC